MAPYFLNKFLYYKKAEAGALYRLSGIHTKIRRKKFRKIFLAYTDSGVFNERFYKALFFLMRYSHRTAVLIIFYSIINEVRKYFFQPLGIGKYLRQVLRRGIFYFYTFPCCNRCKFFYRALNDI